MLLGGLIEAMDIAIVEARLSTFGALVLPSIGIFIHSCMTKLQQYHIMGCCIKCNLSNSVHQVEAVISPSMTKIELLLQYLNCIGEMAYRYLYQVV